MKRGDIVLTAATGDYGKVRPAVIVQADELSDTDSVIVSLMSSVIVDAPASRLTIEPNGANGLRERSQIMVEKLLAVPRRKCHPPIGRLDADEILALDQRIAFVMGLARQEEAP